MSHRQASILRAIQRGHTTSVDIRRERGISPASKWAHRNLMRAIVRLERAGFVRREMRDGRVHWCAVEGNFACAT